MQQLPIEAASSLRPVRSSFSSTPPPISARTVIDDEEQEDILLCAERARPTDTEHADLVITKSFGCFEDIVSVDAGLSPAAVRLYCCSLRWATDPKELGTPAA